MYKLRKEAEEIAPLSTACLLTDIFPLHASFGMPFEGAKSGKKF